MLQSLKLPRIISRNLRPLSEREYFKSYEWKYILLFAAYPILEPFLPERYDIAITLQSDMFKLDQISFN